MQFIEVLAEARTSTSSIASLQRELELGVQIPQSLTRNITQRI